MTRHGGIRAVPGNGTDWVVPAALALLAVQLAFRGWAAWSSWYFLDDLIFLRRAAEGSDWEYLIEPLNGHVMPGGKLVFWAIGTVGTAEWWPAALFLVVGQALASLACLWMLVSLFGARPAILPPFVLYLFLPLSVPSYMWFIAALQQLPLQIALGVGVGAWVRYLRGRSLRWLLVTLAAFVLGLVFWQKTLFLVPLLAFLSLAYFSSGGPVRRVWQLRGQAAALLAVLAVAVAYLAYYTARVPGQFTSVTARLAGDFADTMLGSTLASGLVGGPWRWHDPAPPNAFADPPGVVGPRGLGRDVCGDRLRPVAPPAGGQGTAPGPRLRPRHLPARAHRSRHRPRGRAGHRLAVPLRRPPGARAVLGPRVHRPARGRRVLRPP